MLITTAQHKILIDCGIYQSNSRLNDFLVNNRKFKGFKPKNIDLLFITHTHADHCLLAPKLYKDGCKAETIISENSKRILAKMEYDGAKINERDVELINHQRKKNYEPIYTAYDVDRHLTYVKEYPVNQKIVYDEELAFQLIPSGHLLGSTQILLYVTTGEITKTILFTGDLGNPSVNNPFVGKFEPVTKTVDIVIGESTYGDRPELKTTNKERKNDLDKLKTIIDERVIEQKGKLLIPVFAQSRSQVIAYFLWQLYNNDPTFETKIYIDSPLSIELFKEYQTVLSDIEKNDFEQLMLWPNLIFVSDVEKSKQIVASNEPCIILSTNGMCTVGRVRHHLKSMIQNPINTILFVGYCTEGSLGYYLKKDAYDQIIIDSIVYQNNCQVYNLKSMSGHATFNNLLDYYSSLSCSKIILHHGSKKAKEKLGKKLEQEYSRLNKTTRVVISNAGLKFSI